MTFSQLSWLSPLHPPPPIGNKCVAIRHQRRGPRHFGSEPSSGGHRSNRFSTPISAGQDEAPAAPALVAFPSRGPRSLLDPLQPLLSAASPLLMAPGAPAVQGCGSTPSPLPPHLCVGMRRSDLINPLMLLGLLLDKCRRRRPPVNY